MINVVFLESVCDSENLVTREIESSNIAYP
jgi:hypothetical protein